MQTYSQEVFSGNRLFDTCQYQEKDPHFFLMGHNALGEPMRIPVGEQMLSRHLLLLGGIGTGKSNAFNFLIRNVRSSLTDRDVVIIFDTKGDFYREFYQPGDVVISNDSRADGGSGPDYWNLFGEVTIDDRVEENILEIAKSFFSEKLAHTTQPFFPNAAKDLFSALLLHMVRSDQFASSRNNQALRSLFDTFSVPAMKRILQSHQDLKAMTSYIEDEKSGQTLGVVAELQQMVREIFVGNFRKKGGLSMRQLVRQKGGRVIFVEYDLGIGAMLTPVYRLLIDLAVKEALCRTSNEGSVYFFIDEFRLLPHLEHIDDGVNFGRSLGAKFFVGIQNIDQIAAAYGQNLARSILSGFGTTLAFRVNDAGSREYIKGLFGRNIKLQTYLSAIQNRGVSEQIREGFVVEDEDITNLPVGQAIIGAPGCQPFRFQFKRYG
ncbi:type IV secretory system conjugative DNA transfer family protein [Pseudoflavonifractor sp.]|jgi:type IV secretory pathway TraG/TraD family ATPase VirD4|uniref:type IV secretory system conjugative DNA transfer family protein n=1 Tax=Pseudoflavonifractor sp. TaxID=1980281 RepID=UPI003D8EFE28